MINVCIMSGHDGQLRSEKKFYFTLMGQCAMTKPTIARLIMDQRNRSPQINQAPTPKFFLTIMGNTELTCPTLTQEFLDLRELIDSGNFSLHHWDQTLADLATVDHSIASFTLMGQFDEHGLPPENDEVDGLALHRHLGNLCEESLNILQSGVGLRGAERHTIIYRALEADLESEETASRQIATGVKQGFEDPWKRADINYIPGQTIQGTVTKITNFGVFVELEEGIEGLVHTSELADHKVNDPRDEVRVRDKMQVKILSVDSVDRSITLSKKRAEWAA